MTGDIIYECIQKMYNVAIKIQDEVREKYCKSMSNMAWAKEFATIKIGNVRRSGHNYGMYKFLKENPNLNAVIISYGSCMNSFVKKDMIETGINMNRIFLTTSSRPDGEITKRIDVVIVNPSSLLSKTEIDNIYKSFNYLFQTREGVYIFLE